MGTCLSCQCSSKKSAATTFPADSPLGAWFRSRIAQSGSFGFWSEFVRSWASRKVGPELMTTYLVVERGLGYMRTGRWWSAEKDRLLLGNCFWREGLEAAFGPERRGGERGVRGEEGRRQWCDVAMAEVSARKVPDPRHILLEPGGFSTVFMAGERRLPIRLAKIFLAAVFS